MQFTLLGLYKQAAHHLHGGPIPSELQRQSTSLHHQTSTEASKLSVQQGGAEMRSENWASVILRPSGLPKCISVRQAFIYHRPPALPSQVAVRRRQALIQSCEASIRFRDLHAATAATPPAVHRPFTPTSTPFPKRDRRIFNILVPGHIF